MSFTLSEALLLCLAGSLIWAPIVYVVARLLDRDQTLRVTERIWMAALAASVLPAALAPAFSTAGFSLRPMIVEAPLEAFAPAETFEPAFVETAPVAAAAQPAAAPEPASIVTMETIAELTGLLYLYGAGLAFALWAFGKLGFAAKLISAKPMRDPALLAAIEDWRDRLDVKATPRLRQSDAISSVCVYGLFRPVILIPTTLKDRVSEEDVLLMCAHELAHVKRGDVRLFAVCAAARILFWFNPFIKRIAARLELAAEQCADGLVVERGVNRRTYAACFVEGLRFAAARKSAAMAGMPSFTPFDRSGRRKRLDSILSSTFSGAISVRTRLLLALASTAAAGAVFVQAAVAVHPHERDNEVGVITQMPVDGKITVGFGKKIIDPETGKIKDKHRGVDIKARRGADVVAPGAGVVVEATDLFNDNPDWGKVVVINHGDGLKTLYAHLDSYAVSKGDRVWAGEKIAKVGSTGASTGPHLHFEAILNGEAVDPGNLLALAEPTPPEPPAAPRPAQKTDAETRAAVDLPPEILLEAYEEVAEAASDVYEDAGESFMDSDLDNESSVFEVDKKKSKDKKRRAENRDFTGGEKLSLAERQKIERALKSVRRQAEASKVERDAERQRQRAERKLKKEARKYAKHAEKYEDDYARQQKYVQQAQEEATRQMLIARDRAIEMAKNSAAQTERSIERSLRQVERQIEQELKRNEYSDRLAKVSKKDAEKFKRDLKAAEKEIERTRRERVEALREAEEKIAEQQAEIDRLRAALAQNDVN